MSKEQFVAVSPESQPGLFLAKDVEQFHNNIFLRSWMFRSSLVICMHRMHACMAWNLAMQLLCCRAELNIKACSIYVCTTVGQLHSLFKLCAVHQCLRCRILTFGVRQLNSIESVRKIMCWSAPDVWCAVLHLSSPVVIMFGPTRLCGNFRVVHLRQEVSKS